MTNIIKQAAHVAADIQRKEAEISEFRAAQFVEADKFTLIGILAVEASIQNFRKGSSKAGDFRDTVCFDVLGQKNASGKGKKLAENAFKLAKHEDFEDIVSQWKGRAHAWASEAESNLVAGKFRDEINQRCEELKINSFNQLIAHLNPKPVLSDAEMLIELAQKIAKAQGHDVATEKVKKGKDKGKVTWASPAARQAVIALLQDAADTVEEKSTKDVLKVANDINGKLAA